MTDYAKLARRHFNHGASFDELYGDLWLIGGEANRFAYKAELDKIKETYLENVEKLRAEYEKVETVDPSQPTYGELCRFLDNSSTGMLRLLMNADVKWLSPLARNRYNARRGLKMKRTAKKIDTLRTDLALLVDPAEQPHLWGIINVMLCGHLDSRQQQGLLNDLQARGLINEDGSIK